MCPEPPVEIIGRLKVDRQGRLEDWGGLLRGTQVICCTFQDALKLSIYKDLLIDSIIIYDCDQFSLTEVHLLFHFMPFRIVLMSISKGTSTIFKTFESLGFEPVSVRGDWFECDSSDDNSSYDSNANGERRK